MRRPGSNKVVETFAEACERDVLIRPARRKPATKILSIRLTEDEHAHLSREAGKVTLSHYARCKLFDGKDFAPEKRHRRPKKRVKAPGAEKALLGQILALLGGSDIASSLRELAKAARLGALPESPETIAAINKACSTVDGIHAALIRALGLRS